MESDINKNECPVCGKKLCRRKYVYIHLRNVHHIDPTPYYKQPVRTPDERKRHRKAYMKEWGRKYRKKIKNDPEYRRYHREYQKRYVKTSKGKEANKKARLKWLHSPKGEAWMKKKIWKRYQEKRNERRRERWQSDPRYRLNQLMANGIYYAIRDQKAGRHWEKLVGYSIDELIKHLEDRFDNKMTWENYGSYWVVDHIRPKSWFHYDGPDDEEFRKCWALDNLQPLEKEANYLKGDKYEG